MAFESPLITSDMVEVIEFPQLGVKYNVSGVPKIVVNEELQIEGAVPEPMLMQWIDENINK